LITRTACVKLRRSGSTSRGQAACADGVGAFVGGPPPFGFQIRATFDPAKSALEFWMVEGQQRRRPFTLTYDPLQKVSGIYDRDARAVSPAV